MKMFEIMNREIVFATPSTSATEALKQMREFEQDCLLVCESGEVVGTVNKDDLARLPSASCEVMGEFSSVRTCIDSQFPFCYESDDVEIAVGRMLSHQGEFIAVFDDENQISGVSTLSQTAAQLSSPVDSELSSGLSAGSSARPSRPAAAKLSTPVSPPLPHRPAANSLFSHRHDRH